MVDHRPLRAVLAGMLAVVPAATSIGCGGQDDRVTVFAASSLTDVFAVLEADFESRRPGVDVVVSFDGSSTLATQIEQGAPVDVFAAADDVTMSRVLDEADGVPVPFARNRLAIAVERGNPEGIADLADLERSDLVVVLAAPEVPAGTYAFAALAEAGIEVEPASFEQSVRSVAGKVALGEADAGLVYRTDIVAQPERLEEVAIETAVVPEYPIVVVDDDRYAREFVELVLGPIGRTALENAGFEAP